MPVKLVARDLLIVAAALGLWRLQIGWTAEAGGAAAVALSVVSGLVLAFCGFLAHEWGHLSGAWLSGSVVHFPDRLLAPLLFHFDSDRNDRSQFLAMSAGGFAASILVVVSFFLLLPLDAWGARVAVVLACVGLVLSLVLEGPVAWRVARGAPLPRGGAYRSSTSAERVSP